MSLNVNPDFGNNPRWLWESVALYEAGEFRDPSQIDYLRARDYPTIEELNSGFNTSRNIYDVGFLLTEYILETWGRSELIDLIHSAGDIPGVLGVSESDFELGWYSHIERQHLGQ